VSGGVVSEHRRVPARAGLSGRGGAPLRGTP